MPGTPRVHPSGQVAPTHGHMQRKYEKLNEDQWLLQHARNDTSEWGEDGIIEKIFELIPPVNRWCVEFGAWDGKHTSNTYSLMNEHGWSGVFIEADRQRFGELLETYRNNPRAHCINRFVSFAGIDSLDAILAEAPIPKDFDLLSIDIDGNDYHIWDSLQRYQPRVVIVEFNLTIPSHVQFVQPRNMCVQQGSSPLSLANLGKIKGYELVCVTGCNALFVRSSLFPAFRIGNNSVSRLRSPVGLEYHLFQLYDGTFVVGGPERMPWQDLPLRQEKFQVLPRGLRIYDVPRASFFKRALRRTWAYLYRRGLV